MTIYTTEDGRGVFKELVEKIKPIEMIMAPFGVDGITDILDYNEGMFRLLTTPEKQEKPKTEAEHIKQMRRINFFSGISEIRENKNVHAKIIIGKNGAIVGSWNFTEASTIYKHEVVDFITDPKDTEKLRIFFEKIWSRSRVY